MDSSIRPIVRREVMTIGRTENFTNPTVAKRTYTVAEVMDILGVSRKKAYELCNSGSFKIVHIGRSIRVSKASFDAGDLSDVRGNGTGRRALHGCHGDDPYPFPDP